MSDDTPKPIERADKRYNWLRLYSILGRNPKILALKSDSQRFAYVLALCAARDEQLPGEFIDRRYLAAALGKYAKHIDALIEAELLREDSDGTIAVPQWSYWQPETPSRAEEGRRYRERLKQRLAGTDPTVGTRGPHEGTRVEQRGEIDGRGPDLTGGTRPDANAGAGGHADAPPSPGEAKRLLEQFGYHPNR